MRSVACATYANSRKGYGGGASPTSSARLQPYLPHVPNDGDVAIYEVVSWLIYEPTRVSWPRPRLNAHLRISVRSPTARFEARLDTGTGRPPPLPYS